jgi:hypothetical protein
LFNDFLRRPLRCRCRRLYSTGSMKNFVSMRRGLLGGAAYRRSDRERHRAYRRPQDVLAGSSECASAPVSHSGGPPPAAASRRTS